ncbi:hypothetical protein FHU30_009090 [Actinomadura rupiterrae]|nr:hypothetical protein [Actinomadura rupiterrae]
MIRSESMSAADTAADVPVAVMRRAAAEGLRERFPGLWFWWGPHTGHWWAYVPGPGLGRLVEGETPDGLGMALTRLRARGWGW